MSNPLTWVIARCGDCQFNYDGIECKHPSGGPHRHPRYNADDTAAGDDGPDWCPLRTTQVTVRKAGT